MNNLTLDPRYRRLKRLLASNVLDMQDEKFLHYNTLPSSRYDLYIRNIRSGQSNYRQVGCPEEQENRDMECNTDYIETHDQCIQFNMQDDTNYYNLLTIIGYNKITPNQRKSLYDILKDDYQSNQSKDKLNKNNRESNNKVENSSQLSNFLQYKSHVMETLLTEIESYQSDSNQERSQVIDNKGISGDIFDVSSNWKLFGQNSNNGSLELLRTRVISGTKYSKLHPNQLVTIHPPPSINDPNYELDLRPNKSLFAIWDMHNPSTPQYILESHGIPTSICFSNTQSYHIIAGTYDGCLNLWDHRESISFHKDKDAMDLRIEYGIRKPCYTTNYMLNVDLDIAIVTERRQETLDYRSHTYPIVQVESLDDSSSSSGNGSSNSGVLSQFLSLDSSGLVILWVTSQDSTSLTMDPGMSPWSTVKLLPMRYYETFLTGLDNSTMKIMRAPDSPMKEVRYRGPQDEMDYAIGVCTVPNDVTSFCVASFNYIQRISRSNQTITPCKYQKLSAVSSSSQQREEESKIDQFLSTPPSLYSGSGDPYQGFICVMATNTLQSPSATLELLLIGSSDGNVDLYRLDHSQPIYTWNLTDYDKNLLSASSSSYKSKGTVIPKNASTVYLKWLTKSCFLAVDNLGGMFYFDLLVNVKQPIAIDSINITITNQSNLIEEYLSIHSPVPLNNMSLKGQSYTGLFDITSLYSYKTAVYLMVVDNQQPVASSSGKSVKKSDIGPGSPSGVKYRLLNSDLLKVKENEDERMIHLLLNIDSNI